MKRMSKMEAVGSLCEIKSQITKELECCLKRVNDQKKQPSEEKDPQLLEYYAREIETMQRQIRALEMAGTAMTR